MAKRFLIKTLPSRAAWVAQSVNHLTLDFGSGHDLRVMRLSPAVVFVLGMEPTWDLLPLFLPFPHLKMKKTTFKKLRQRLVFIRFCLSVSLCQTNS